MHLYNEKLSYFIIILEAVDTYIENVDTLYVFVIKISTVIVLICILIWKIQHKLGI